MYKGILNMNVKKAGGVLIDLNTQKIGIIFRPRRKKDFSFPKGHLEKGETIQECAIREIEEETGRVCHLFSQKEVDILKYIDPDGNNVEVYMYLAIDESKSLKIFKEELVEKLIWKNFNEVEEILSYQNLKDFWNKIKPNVINVLEGK